MTGETTRPRWTTSPGVPAVASAERPCWPRRTGWRAPATAGPAAGGRGAGRAGERAAERASEPTRRRSTPTWRSAVLTLKSGPVELAASLGLPADLDRPATGLSGGQAARLALAAVLLARFDVLLLDEPTNDLDLTGLELLESHLAAFRGGLVVVSHDRAFLERTARQVLQIDPHTPRGQALRRRLPGLPGRTRARPDQGRPGLRDLRRHA